MDIDLNVDLGEGAGFDAELMPLVTSANVCCGLHAGGPSEMSAAFTLADQYGVVTGAHPGYPDREHFGRRDTGLSLDDLTNSLIYQIGAAVALGRANESPVTYVKPHGALYHRACGDRETADVVTWACEQFRLPVVGLPRSALADSATRHGTGFVAEGFADRRYRPDGSLVPRAEPDAFVHDPDEAVRQVEWLVRDRGVRTVCVHGDNPDAVAFTRAVRAGLLARGFVLKAFA